MSSATVLKIRLCETGVPEFANTRQNGSSLWNCVDLGKSSCFVVEICGYLINFANFSLLV